MAVSGTPMSNSSRGKTKSSEATRRIHTKVEAAQEAHSSRKKAKNRQRETITRTAPKMLAGGALRLCGALS